MWQAARKILEVKQGKKVIQSLTKCTSPSFGGKKLWLLVNRNYLEVNNWTLFAVQVGGTFCAHVIGGVVIKSVR